MRLWPDQIEPARVALHDPATGREITYGELAEPYGEVERALAFVWCDETIDSAAALVRLMNTGHAVFLGDARLSPARREALETRYRPSWVWDGSLRATGTMPVALHPDLALLVSTSGSTGSPKLVRLSRDAVRSNARAIADYLSLTTEERAPMNLPLSYAYGLSVLNSHLAVGATVVETGTNVMRREFWEAMRLGRCTSLAGVPYTWRMLLRLRLERLDLGHVRTVTQAGGHLERDAKRTILAWARANEARFFVMYGQTEATARMSFVPPEALEDHLESIGRPIAGGRFELLDRGDHEELVYEGPNVMMGYAERPEDLARGDDLGGRLETGDIAWRDDDGYYYVSGRARRFVKVLGHRVDLDWLEEALREGIGHELAVVGRDDQVVAFVEDGALVAPILQAAIEMQIERRAFRVEVVDALPRASSGKLNRGALMDRIEESEE